MRDRLWTALTVIKFKQIYYEIYQLRSHVYDAILSGICLLTASSAIVLWDFWNNLPVLWSVLIAISQVIQVLRPLLPFQKQLSALSYLVPDLILLANDVDHAFLSSDNLSEDEILKQITLYEDRVYALETRYTGNIYFPPRKRIKEEAEKERDVFLKYRYPLEEGGEEVATQEAPITANT